MTNRMWKKVANLSFALSFCSLKLLADNSAQVPPEQRPYDYDLFSKDRDAIFLNGELLYRNVLESGLEYVSSMKIPQSSPPASSEDQLVSSTSGPIGDYRNVKFKWKPGFRFSLGYFNAAKYWDVSAQYTWYESRGDSAAGEPGITNQYLQPTVPVKGNEAGQTLITTVSSARASTHYRYNLVDALVNRNFFPNPHLRLRVTGGITGTWQDQSFTSRYFFSDTTYSRTSYDWGYWGFGLRGGANADWYWGKNFYFTAKMTGAATVGRYVNKTKTVYQATATSAYDSLLADNHYDDYRGAFNIQFSLGPSWQQSYENTRFELFLGYEIESWFNLAEFRTYELADNNAYHLTETKKTPLTMNGLALRFTSYV